MVGYLILGILVALVIGYLALDYFMLKNGHDLTRRLKYFFIPLVSFPLGAFLLWACINDITNSIDLAKNGVEVVAIVKESKVERKYRRMRLRIYYINTLIYDGRERNFDLDKEYAIGTKFYLVYSAKNPNNAKVSRSKGSFIAYFFDDKNLWSLFVFIVIPLFCFAVGLRSIILLFKKESALDSIEE